MIDPDFAWQSIAGLLVFGPPMILATIAAIVMDGRGRPQAPPVAPRKAQIRADRF